MKVLILGANGMIGSTMFRVLREKGDLSVFGTLRTSEARRLFSADKAACLIDGVDAAQPDALLKAFALAKPDVVLNCIGLTKHRPEAEDPLQTFKLNAVLPHRLAHLCEVAGARLIHVSTDCVFLGTKGSYAETDAVDADDFYGKSKYLGEVATAPHAVTLRTSTIGHELHTRYGLLEWFLSQQKQCNGFSRAIFSGLPTVVFAQVVRDVVIPRPTLSGLYHVAAKPINKLALLELIARIYKKDINIIPDGSLVIDRSLDGTRFSAATGYLAPGWEEMIYLMHAHAQ
jgi:dTDP-4-dehydrorhamnose reductase